MRALAAVSLGVVWAFSTGCGGSVSPLTEGDSSVGALSTLAAARSAPRPEPVINVRDQGALGTGNGDDQAALNVAVAKVMAAGHGTLYFPAGHYHIGRQTSLHQKAVLAFTDVSNVTLDFAPGAVLDLDNLTPEGAGDQGHGIYFKGHCQHIWLVNAHVAWVPAARKRSLGDGIHVDGFPSEEGSASDIHLISPTVEGAPQAGIIFMGASDVTVMGSLVKNTQADALHFNACRRVTVQGHTALDNGDDALAFVTYYDPSSVYLGNRQNEGPYAQPDLGDWSDTDSSASDIFVKGGRANGCRLDSVNGITLKNLTVENKGGAGLMVDATEASDGGTSAADGGTGNTYNWTVRSSKGVRVDGLNVSGSGVGFDVTHQGGHGDPFGSAPRFWQFDVLIENLVANDNRGRFGGGAVEHVSGVTVNHVKGNQGTHIGVTSDSLDIHINPN